MKPNRYTDPGHSERVILYIVWGIALVFFLLGIFIGLTWTL